MLNRTLRVIKFSSNFLPKSVYLLWKVLKGSLNGTGYKFIVDACDHWTQYQDYFIRYPGKNTSIELNINRFKIVNQFIPIVIIIIIQNYRKVIVHKLDISFICSQVIVFCLQICGGTTNESFNRFLINDPFQNNGKLVS